MPLLISRVATPALRSVAARPGLLRVASGDGTAVGVEVWILPATQVGALLARSPAPLRLGTVLLADDTAPKGFLVEAEGVRNAQDITRFGGWRRLLVANAPA